MKKTTTFLLVGGYGNAGQAIVKALVSYYRQNSSSSSSKDDANIKLLIAGRHLDRATAFIKDITTTRNDDGGCPFPTQISLEGRTVDMSDIESLKSVLVKDHIDMIVVASSSTEHVETVVQAVREVGNFGNNNANNVDYFDVQFSRSKTAYLQRQQKDGLLQNQLWITDGGFHPGLPGAMIRFVCEQQQQQQQHSGTGGTQQQQPTTEANVFGLISYDWNSMSATPSGETMDEFVDEMKNFECKILKDGEWKDLGSTSAFMNPISMDFGEPIGTRDCIAMYLDELEDLPRQYPSLQDAGFYIAGFHWFIDWFVMPFALIMLSICPSSKRTMGKLLLKSLQTFCGPPFKTMLKTKTSTGYNNLIVSHDDSYALTGMPIAATMIQYTQGKFEHKKGLHFQANIVDIEPFFHDMKQMGAHVEVVET